MKIVGKKSNCYMTLQDYQYHLPPELIAQTPLPQRDSSRLMLLNKTTGEIQHSQFSRLTEYLRPGDCLVLNDTRVIPARLFGVNTESCGAVELLLLHSDRRDEWECLVKPGKRCKAGARLAFGEGETALYAEVVTVKDDGNRILRFDYNRSYLFENLLDKLGHTPLPPYIKETLSDPERYQTVYAKEAGSAAAPTAGLHFTPELLQAVADMGIATASLTLHVGLGTFRPIKGDPAAHQMHSEYYHVPAAAIETIRKTKANGGRVIAVGTTSARTLETIAMLDGEPPYSGSTDIFIYPPYKFKLVDALITNFHLPGSTLLLLVSALAGRENIMNAYKVAVDERYRFFSFGDCMFIQ